MILSVVFGILAGLIGFSPMFFVRHLVKRGRPLARNNALSLGIVSIVASLILLVALLFVARRIAPELFLVFAIALVTAFLLANVCYAIWENRR